MDKKTLGKSVKIELNGSNRVYYQTLLGHTIDALHIANAYFNLKDEEVRDFCSRWGITESEFKKYTLLSVALHDVGKITEEFQNNIKNGKSSADYPHSFWAIPILLSVFGIKLTDSPNFSIIDNKTLEFISILAVLGHHTQLHMQMYQYVNKDINFICEEIENFFSNLRKFFNQIKDDSISNMFGSLNEVCRNASSMGRYKVHNWIKKLSAAIFDDENFDNSVKVKSVFSFLFSILQLADDYSSMNFSEFVMKNADKNQQIFDSVLQKGEAQKYVPILNAGNIKDNVILNGKKPRKFQEDTKNSNKKFLFLFAPCGRGKTEASLLWAIETMRKHHRDKIIFALPTQVTCNAMYERLVSEFGKEKVGLYHGRSFLVIDSEREKKKDKEEDRSQYIKEETFKSSVFLKPVTVTTVDHLAFSLIHGFSQADFATGNLQNSVVIFDEIHYYEQHTLEILMSLFKILRKMSIPHILMTGTAPDFILKSIRGEYKIIEDNEGLDFKPFSVEKNKDLLVFKNKNNKEIIINNKVFDSIQTEYLNNKKIFVTLNRVDFAQKFYLDCKKYFENNGIKNPNIILYHSRFIYKDRIAKESEIKKCANEDGKHCVIIATQVIEISLDISSDTMYSQIAPPDAIGQRAGRLHRGGKSPEGHILKLFNVKDDANNSLPYNSDLLLKSWSAFDEGDKSYRQIKEICDKVYQGRNTHCNTKYEEFFLRNILFGDVYYEVAHPDESGNGIRIREEKYLTINVIPSRFEQDIYSADHVEEFECIIPYYMYSSNPNLFEKINISNKKSVIVADLEYNYDTGLLPKKAKDDFKGRSF